MDDLSGLSIRELLELCLRAGRNEDAWCELVRRIEQVAHGVIYKRLARARRPTLEMVEDLVQKTLEKLIDRDYKALRELRFDHDGSFFAFIKTVAANAASDHLRKPSTNKEEALEEAAEPPDPGKSAEDLQRKIQLDRFDDYIKKSAAEEDYEIFRMHYHYGFSASQIAGLPGVELNVKGVEYVLWKLVRLLRQQFNRDDRSDKRPGEPAADDD